MTRVWAKKTNNRSLHLTRSNDRLVRERYNHGIVNAMKEQYKEIKAKERKERNSQMSLGTAALEFTQNKYGEGVN